MSVEFLKDGKTGDHATDVLYPAIRRAMVHLRAIPAGFDLSVDDAFNTLRDAFFSESPPTKYDDDRWPVRQVQILKTW